MFSQSMSKRSREWLSSFVMLLLLVIFFDAHAASSEEYVEEAEAYIQKGDMNAAIIQLKNALKQDPKNVKARFLLGQTYLQRGNGPGAEKELERARRLGMDWQQVIIPLGRAYLFQGKGEKVLEDLKVEDDFPSALKAELLVLHANAYLMQNQRDKAEGAFERALQLAPDSADAMLGKARLAVVDRRLPESQQLVDLVLQAYPENSEAWAVHGELARLKGDLSTAKQSFDKAVELRPSNLSALLGSAGVRIALGDLEGAEKKIDEVRRASPNLPQANYLHAVVLYRNKDLDGAGQALQQVLRVAPGHMPSQQMMGAIDFAKGRYEQAEYSLSRVVGAYPDNKSAVKLLAATRLKLKRADEAIQIMERVLPKAKDDVQLLALLGSAYLRSGDTEKGINYLERAAAAAPEAAGIRTQLALGHLASGETSEAIKELETAVDLGKNVVQAELLLTMVHLRSKEYDKALKQAQAFAAKAPDSPLPENLMGTVYVALDKPKMAREKFEQALVKDAHFVPAITNLGRLDENEGQTDAAKKRYQSVLKQREGHLGALMSLAGLAGRQGDEQQALKYLQAAWEANSGALQPGLTLVKYYNDKQQALRSVSIARELKALHPDNVLVVNALGLSLLNAKDYYSAKEEFELLVKLAPKSAQAHHLLGVTKQELGDTSSARKSFAEALKLAADYLPTQLALAKLELKAKQPQAALRIAETIQQQRPKEAVGFRLQGDVLMVDGSYQAAAEAYKQAFDKANTAQLVLAIYRARKAAKLEPAYAPLEQWLKNHGDDAAVRTVLASAYQESGRLEAAVEQYQQVLKGRPKDVVVLNNLAWASHQLGRDDAVKYAERAYELAPHNPAITDTLGWLLIETGKTNRGLVLVQQAVLEAPDLVEVRYHLAVGLHRAGRDAEAESELKRVLELSPDFAQADAARALLKELQRK